MSAADSQREKHENKSVADWRKKQAKSLASSLFNKGYHVTVINDTYGIV
jgi:hypothetical protein